MGTIRLVNGTIYIVTRLHNAVKHVYYYIMPVCACIHMLYMIHLGLIIVIRLFVRFTFQSSVSPGRISGLSKPSTVL